MEAQEWRGSAESHNVLWRLLEDVREGREDWKGLEKGSLGLDELIGLVDQTVRDVLGLPSGVWPDAGEVNGEMIPTRLIRTYSAEELEMPILEKCVSDRMPERPSRIGGDREELGEQFVRTRTDPLRFQGDGLPPLAPRSAEGSGSIFRGIRSDAPSSALPTISTTTQEFGEFVNYPAEGAQYTRNSSTISSGIARRDNLKDEALVIALEEKETLESAAADALQRPDSPSSSGPGTMDFSLQLSGLSQGLQTRTGLSRGDISNSYMEYDLIFKSDDPPTEVLSGMSLIQIAAGDFFVHSDLLKRWNLGKTIGRGSSSVVKIAKEANDPRGREVAIKMISKKTRNYKERAVSREIFIWRLLMETGGHENIVNMYEVAEDESRVYLTMECLTGGPLQDLLVTDKDLPEDRVASIAAQMLQSVKHCHDLNIVHRDVKPENFVFSSEDLDSAKLTLTDFGISFYSTDPDALCTTTVGTPLYVAPEILYRERYGAEADIWSIGVIVHILLRGQPPFETEDGELHSLLAKIKYHNVKFDGPSWILVSDDAKNFLTGLLQKDPSKRLTAAEAINHPWIVNTARHRSSSQALIYNARLNIGVFFARKRWTSAILAVMCVNRMLQSDNLRDFADVNMPDSQRLLNDYRRNKSLTKQQFVKKNIAGSRAAHGSRHNEPTEKNSETVTSVPLSDSPTVSESGMFKKLKSGMDGMQKNITVSFLGAARLAGGSRDESESGDPERYKGNSVENGSKRREQRKKQGTKDMNMLKKIGRMLSDGKRK